MNSCSNRPIKIDFGCCDIKPTYAMFFHLEDFIKSINFSKDWKFTKVV